MTGYRQGQSLYGVDLVLCIDCTESMDNVLGIVKDRALSFHNDLLQLMSAKGKQLDRLRVRVIAFRDYLACEDEVKKHAYVNEPMMIADFFELPYEAKMFEASVKSLQPSGGGDREEDGLEALAYAMRSDWSLDAWKNRHVIVLWSDEEPHPLGFGCRAHAGASRYPRGMARDLTELSLWWGDNQDSGYMPLQASKRLILFAPDAGAWKTISDTWDNVLHLPSKAGDHLREIDYQAILSSIAQTIA